VEEVQRMRIAGRGLSALVDMVSVDGSLTVQLGL